MPDIISLLSQGQLQFRVNSIQSVKLCAQLTDLPCQVKPLSCSYICVCVPLWFIVLTQAHTHIFTRTLWVLTSVMGSAGFGWSGLSGRFVGDVAAAGCTPGPKPNKVRQINVYICIKYVFNNCLIAVCANRNDLMRAPAGRQHFSHATFSIYIRNTLLMSF